MSAADDRGPATGERHSRWVEVEALFQEALSQGPETRREFLAERCPDAEAIVHTHSPMATALSCARIGIPPFHYMIAICGGPGIRCAEYATFGSQQLADGAVKALWDRKAALLANHGLIAIGATLEGARVIAAEVENLATQYLALLQAGIEPTPLGEAELRRIPAHNRVPLADVA